MSRYPTMLDPRDPDFWSVNEDEPGLGGVLIAFAVFTLLLVVVLVYVVVMAP